MESPMKHACYHDVPCLDAMFPRITAGPIQIRCNEPGCRWEAMYVLPEEMFKYFVGVLVHMREVHGVRLCNMTSENL